MSTAHREPSRTLPPLVDGQHLDQPTFHRRYEAMPRGTWAELVGGVVRMPSPLFDDHAEVDDAVTYWLVSYKRRTPGLRSGSNSSTILGPGDEVQPDSQLRLPPEAGGRARVVGGYVTGPPELVVEVSRSSRPYDLGEKKDAYERAGVPEYVVVGLGPPAVRWFALRDGRYAEQPPGADGLHRSAIFPGLWLDPAALLAGDLDRLLAALGLGLATAEHAAFAARLAGLARGPGA